jgi:hypothetical protein
MARDILSVPISGVSVERIFSIARHICTYQRNRLNPDTIQQLMVVRQRHGLLVQEDEERQERESEEDIVEKKSGHHEDAQFKVGMAQEIADNEDN